MNHVVPSVSDGVKMCSAFVVLSDGRKSGPKEEQLMNVSVKTNMVAWPLYKYIKGN